VSSLPPADSDLGALTAAFNGMADALQDRVERDARFASDVSHELRSPLMTLSASIEVMQARRDEMPDRAAAALDLLVGDVNRFRVLVEDLLEISRFDAGKVRLHMEELLVAEFVRQAVSVSSIPSAPIRVSEVAESTSADWHAPSRTSSTTPATTAAVMSRFASMCPTTKPT
jgi:two-component system, OmpR family, sensor histidine kinase MtrB